jgi:gamma-tubulin complex component 3
VQVHLPQTDGATGWDSFSLDYKPKAPIDALISQRHLASYRQLFVFLWRLKRVEYQLTAVWQQHGFAAHILPALRGDALVHACHTLRNQMIHFVVNLQYYLMFEVIECSWKEMMDSFDAAANLDDLIGAHDAFLGSVLKKALLTRDDAPLLRTLKALFETILLFSEQQAELYLSLLELKALT